MIVGIDIGTTNSAIAYWHGGEPRLIPNALKGELTPSAVSIEKNGAVHIGSSALDRMAFAPELTATSFKRWMGTKQSVRLGRGKPHDATEMSAMVLRSLLDDAEAHLGERPTEAVITVPAYFNDKQRKATRHAGEMAGVAVRRLINEPTAAALAFGLQDKEDREPFLVFDLGGGTFDVSIVEKFENIIEVRASSGDNRLGGDDFNEALIALAAPRLDANKALEALSPAKRNALLFLAAERARRALSTASSTEFSIVVEGKEISTVVTAEEFSAAADPLLKRLKEPVVRALRDCQMNPGDLSEIVLVGGATRMPIVRNALTRMFGRFPNNSIHPDHAVALGAAVQAGLLSGGTDLEEVRITDVAPFSMGIDVAERDQFGRMRTGIFSPIIERNTPVPCSREQVYSTMEPYQKAIKMGVYQGEARMVEQNVELRKFEIRVPERREPVSLVVRFSYDSSGLLEIDTHVPETGESKTFLVVDDEDRADKAELEKRRQALAKLKFHPREDAENVALAARAARCYEGHLGEMRNMVGHWIQLFEGALESQDPREIAHAREQLSANLDALDSQSPL